MKTRTKEEILKIIELYEQGLTGAEIGRRLKMDRHSVNKVLKDKNLPSHMYALTPEKEEIVKTLCNENKSASYISKQVNVSLSVITRYKKLHNYQQYDNTVIKGEKEQELLRLYNEGKRDNFIAEKIGVSCGAIWWYRKNHNLKTKFQHSDLAKIDNKTFEKLFNKGLTDKEIAEKLGMSSDGIYSHRMRHNYLRRNYNCNLEIPLTQFQKEVLIGTLMGDSTLSKAKDTLCPRYSCAHSPKQKELVYHKAEIFKSLNSKVNYRIRNIPDKRNGKYYETYWVWCPHNPAFNKFYKAFYKPKKVIPFELFDDFTEVSLAFMFMDDGCKTSSGYVICTNCFTREDLEKFQIFLKNKFNLSTSIHNNNILYIKACSRDLFTSLVSPYIINCVKYKLHKVS